MSSSREAPGTINDEKSPSFTGEARSQSAMAPRAIWSTSFESSGLPKYWGTSLAVVRDWAAVCLWRPRRRGLRRGPKGSLRVDVLQCSRCQGEMRLIACIEEPEVAKGILEHLGLRAEPLPTLRAWAPPVTFELFPASAQEGEAALALTDSAQGCARRGPRRSSQRRAWRRQFPRRSETTFA